LHLKFALKCYIINVTPVNADLSASCLALLIHQFLGA
jgi:hypothetical protein